MTATPTPAIAQDLAPTGVLRASINLGNPVLAQGTPDSPSGVTVDIAHAVGDRLGVPVELVCFDAARRSFEAMATGAADLCFLAADPARATEVAFTAPYAVIEGVYVVPVDSPVVSVTEGLEVGAGIREPVTAFAARRDDVRVVDEAFMQIGQAVGTTCTRTVETVAFLHELVEELKASGFVADAISRSGQSGAAVAPPA